MKSISVKGSSASTVWGKIIRILWIRMACVPSVREIVFVPVVPVMIWLSGSKVCSYSLEETSTDSKTKAKWKKSSKETPKTLPKSPETTYAPKPKPTKNPSEAPPPDSMKKWETYATSSKTYESSVTSSSEGKNKNKNLSKSDANSSVKKLPPSAKDLILKLWTTAPSIRSSKKRRRENRKNSNVHFCLLIVKKKL